MSARSIYAFQTKYDISVAITIYTIYYGEETTNRVFHLRNLHGDTQEEQVIHAGQIMDEVVQELYYLTGLGIDKGTVKVGSSKVIETVYEEMKPRLENRPFEALHVQFEPTYTLRWKRGTQTTRAIPISEMDQGWQREPVTATRGSPLRLPVATLSFRPSAPQDGYQPFFLYLYPLYRKRKRKAYGFSVKYNRDDPSLQRFLARFYEDGNLSYGDRHYFASKHSRVSLEGRDWPKSRAKPKPGPRRSVLASRPTDDTEYVYLIRAGRTHLYKIGKSNDPQGRLQSLQTASPHKLKLLHVFRADNAAAAEEALHGLLHDRRLEGEWFKLTSQEKDVLVSVERFAERRFWIEGIGVQGDRLFGG